MTVSANVTAAPVDKLHDNVRDASPDKLVDKFVDNVDNSPLDNLSPVTFAEPPAVLPMTPAAAAQMNDGTKYPTGIEIPPELHARVQKAAQARGKNSVVRQTEVLLSAFEAVYPRISELVAQHKNRNRVQSPLFGVRTVQVTETTSAMKRLQVRPTWGQYQALQALASQHDLPLAVLTRLVLKAYFGRTENSASQDTEATEERAET